MNTRTIANTRMIGNLRTIGPSHIVFTGEEVLDPDYELPLDKEYTAQSTVEEFFSDLFGITGTYADYLRIVEVRII